MLLLLLIVVVVGVKECCLGNVRKRGIAWADQVRSCKVPRSCRLREDQDLSRCGIVIYLSICVVLYLDEQRRKKKS